LTSDGGEDRLEMLGQVMDQFEANGVIDIALKTDVELSLISSQDEKKEALNFRQRHFFDSIHIQDPYCFTLDEKDHLHWVLYENGAVIGYVHVQIWEQQRAALRIIVIDEKKRCMGFGKYLMGSIEKELKEQGINLLQIEASLSAAPFYRGLGYLDMPFNSPDKQPTHPDDRAMGKYL
jgi:GNAT superfamily N-acetyltransferase